jgi:hypothetical protein
VRRWQAMQWQTPTPRGAPCTVMLSWPQQQAAVRVVMGISCGVYLEIVELGAAGSWHDRVHGALCLRCVTHD